MKNASFPGWAWPLVGAVFGAFVAQGTRRPGEGFNPTWTAVGAILGVAAGLFLWLLDRPKAGAEPVSEGIRAVGARTQASGYLIGRFLAILAVLLCWFPLVGLIVGPSAWLLNWNVRGWPRTASAIATVIAVLITVLVAMSGPSWTRS